MCIGQALVGLHLKGYVSDGVLWIIGAKCIGECLLQVYSGADQYPLCSDVLVLCLTALIIPLMFG